MKKAISRLPQIKLQDHWKEASDWLLNDNQDEPYVKLDDLRAKAATLTEYDIREMLKALSACGRIVWLVGNEFIFHKIENLAIIMKSLFYHEMRPILLNFADFLKLIPSGRDLLLQKYFEGQLPFGLIKSMY